MKHLLRLFAVTMLLVGALVGLSGSASTATSRDVTIRWDFISVKPQAGVLLSGGHAESADPTSHDTLALTGSGQGEPLSHEANGGGTFVHRDADGTIRERGFYVVTGFVSWKPLAGSFTGVPIIDAVGEKHEARSGILTMTVTGYVGGKAVGTGQLSIHCALPGSPATAFEGFTLNVRNGPNFSEVVEEGPTLFHAIQE